MKTSRLFLPTIILAALLLSCNPDCDSLFNVQAAAITNLAGGEVLLRTPNPNNINQLNGRNIFVNDKELGADDMSFYTDFGLVVKLPEGLTGETLLEVEDFDCGRVPVRLSLQDESFFRNNPDFIIPTPPDVIIPSIPPVFPADITNAWISPNNPDYCLWFGPYKVYEFRDGNDNLVFADVTNIVASGSFELSTCRDESKFYHNNPFFGIVDTVNNHIELTVDRSAKAGLGVLAKEDFIGQFIDIQDTKYEMGPLNGASICGTEDKEEAKKQMMLLTSKQTGQQVIVFKLVNP